MAEVVTNVVMRRLGLRRHCTTYDLPLDGAPDEPWPTFAARTTAELLRHYPLDEAGARHLVTRYGTRAAEVAAYLRDEPHLARRVLPGEPDLLVEFEYQRDHEMAVRPEDHWLRRTRLGLFHPDLLPQRGPALRLRRA